MVYSDQYCVFCIRGESFIQNPSVTGIGVVIDVVLIVLLQKKDL